MIRLGVIGYGYWGKNIVRNFHAASNAQVVAICDLNPDNLKGAKKLYPQITLYEDCQDLIKAADVDAVAIVTPVGTHYELSKLALLQGKHIFVEKPFTENSKQAEELIELAEKKKLQIMVDHTFVFTQAVRKIKILLDEGALGTLHYYDAIRVNLGLFRHDVNVIWDLAPHDFSIMQYVMPQKPKALAAHGMDHYGRGLCNTAYVTVFFEQMIAHFHFNWLSPVKIRSTYIGGQKKMIVWDDMQNDEKLKVYDKGVVVVENNEEELFQHRISYRLGDVWIPQLDAKEALSTEVDHFVQCVQYGKKPINDGFSGLEVVKMLEATDLSLQKQGAMITL